MLRIWHTLNRATYVFAYFPNNKNKLGELYITIIHINNVGHCSVIKNFKII